MVTNTGNVTLTSVAVTDDKGVAVSCPKTTLAVGESMTCTASGTATAGQYRNVGTVTATPPAGSTVTASNPDHYFGAAGAVTLVKMTNGTDNDTPTGPYVAVGSTVNWSYVVTNTGNVTLTSVAVTDDKGVAVTCPKTTLAVAESMTCTATGTASAGQYSNTGTVTATPPAGSTVTASNPDHYFGSQPSLTLVKKTNGTDNDTQPGLYLAVGASVSWTYVVTNTGNVTLTSVAVTDDKGVSVTCPKTTLAVAESMTCTATGTATAGQYTNTGTATGTPPVGSNVTATNPDNYYGLTVVNGVLAPTNTTCENFIGGMAMPEPGLYANPRGQLINSVAPGVIFYYADVTSATGGQQITVQQDVTKAGSPFSWPELPVQGVQAYLYNVTGGSCARSSATPNVVSAGGNVAVTFTVPEGVVATDHLVVGIKFETGSAIGQSYRELTANDNTVTYNFSTLFSFGGAPVLMPGSGASVHLHTKK